jgi:2-oxo-hept-3-ene-1,7-dioate hydratase
VWLTRRLADLGASLQPGELILAGSFTRPLWVERGDEFVADYGGLGSLEFRFA